MKQTAEFKCKPDDEVQVANTSFESEENKKILVPETGEAEQKRQPKNLHFKNFLNTKNGA